MSSKKEVKHKFIEVLPCGTYVYVESFDFKWVIEKIIIEYDNIFYKVTYNENWVIKTMDVHPCYIATSQKDKLIIWYNTHEDNTEI